MKSKIISLLVVFLFTLAIQPVLAQETTDLEIYDIEKEQIVKRIPNTPEIQQDVTQYLKTIDRTIPPLGQVPKKGKMVRIPIQPPSQIENQWIKGTIYEVFFILLPDRDPFIIVYDEARKPYLLQSAYMPQHILKLVNS
ncbi:hypothetical protein [Ammoniphilus sp. YIM 78166]|uniref:hypothetical protein n=1 Tax=Ammoniphilus sp. YIM 78166 TaxID=1644106 RepID=UPI0010705ED2|nr:hypothetical protein [Ammoniphilus sp. YIM 78166]